MPHAVRYSLHFKHPMQTHVCADNLPLRLFRWHTAGFGDSQDGVCCKLFGNDQSEGTSNDGHVGRYFFI